MTTTAAPPRKRQRQPKAHARIGTAEESARRGFGDRPTNPHGEHDRRRAHSSDRRGIRTARQWLRRSGQLGRHARRRRVRRDLRPRSGARRHRHRRTSGLPAEERARNIALATISRASLPVDYDKAFECWQNNGCETGTGGELKVGLADGFGGNVARQLFKMEFILQALTYPEIGEIGYTDANLDTQKAISDVRSFAARDFDIIISYPDAGEALVPAYRAAMEEGSKVITWSGTKVGEPGVDYFTYSGQRRVRHRQGHGERQFGEQLPDGGEIAILLGAPGNTLDPLQEECMTETMPDNIEIVARQGDAWSRESYLKAMSAILAEHPDLDGVLGSYGDAFVGAMRAYEAAGIPMDGLVTMHQSDDNPFLCAWKDAGGVTTSCTSTASAHGGPHRPDGSDDEAPGLRRSGRDPLRRRHQAGDHGVVPYRHPARRLAVELGATRAPDSDVPGVITPPIDEGYRRHTVPVPLASLIRTLLTPTHITIHHHRGPDYMTATTGTDSEAVAHVVAENAERAGFSRCCCSATSASGLVRCRPTTTSRSSSGPARSTPCSARTARASRPC